MLAIAEKMPETSESIPLIGKTTNTPAALLSHTGYMRDVISSQYDMGRALNSNSTRIEITN
jgi:sulfopyruvate decarboxylase TPP-binding subunit